MQRRPTSQPAVASVSPQRELSETGCCRRAKSKHRQQQRVGRGEPPHPKGGGGGAAAAAAAATAAGVFCLSIGPRQLAPNRAAGLRLRALSGCTVARAHARPPCANVSGVSSWSQTSNSGGGGRGRVSLLFRRSLALTIHRLRLRASGRGRLCQRAQGSSWLLLTRRVARTVQQQPAVAPCRRHRRLLCPARTQPEELCPAVRRGNTLYVFATASCSVPGRAVVSSLATHPGLAAGCCTAAYPRCGRSRRGAVAFCPIQQADTSDIGPPSFRRATATG